MSFYYYYDLFIVMKKTRINCFIWNSHRVFLKQLCAIICFIIFFSINNSLLQFHCILCHAAYNFKTYFCLFKTMVKHGSVGCVWFNSLSAACDTHFLHWVLNWGFTVFSLLPLIFSVIVSVYFCLLILTCFPAFYCCSLWLCFVFFFFVFTFKQLTS